MKATVYWIEGPWPGSLAIVLRPRGGDWLEDEVRAWQQAELDVIVSLLTTEENADLDLQREAELSRSAGLIFISFPIVDRSVPAARSDAWELLDELISLLNSGKKIGIHCRQGIGRAALLATSLLILSGLTPEAALQKVSIARGCSVPETAEQRAWVLALARETAKPAASLA